MSHSQEIMQKGEVKRSQRTIQEQKYGKVRRKLDIKQIISDIKKYIESKGFSYNEDLIENFDRSLKSKPFVILAGTSGGYLFLMF